MALAVRELGLRDQAVLEAMLDGLSVGWTDGLAPSASAAIAFLADPSAFVFGAFDGDAPVAWAWGTHIRRPTGQIMTYVHELDVVESHRRRGIATLLMTSVVDGARRHGSHRVWLITRDQNGPARALYDSLGGDDTDEVFRRYKWSFDTGLS